MESIWAALWIVIPVAWLSFEALREWRATEHWYAEVHRLGLRPGENRGLSGKFREVTVDVTHQIQERSKRSPLITFWACARLSDAEASAEVPEPASGTNLTGDIVHGWFERSGFGYFGTKDLEWHLLQLVIAARYASKHPEEYEDDEDDDSSFS